MQGKERKIRWRLIGVITVFVVLILLGLAMARVGYLIAEKINSSSPNKPVETVVIPEGEKFIPELPNQQSDELYLIDVTKTIDTSNLIPSGLIKIWEVDCKSLIITDISDYTLILTVFDEGRIRDEKVKLIADPATEIAKVVPVKIEERVTSEYREIKFTDLQVGDIVRVHAIWQEYDNMEPRATIIVLDERELEMLEDSVPPISWAASPVGVVGGINGRTVSLLGDGEKIDVSIQEGAPVHLQIFKGSRNEVDFGEIKVGDIIGVAARLTEDKELEGTAVYIFPRVKGQNVKSN